MRGLSLIFAVLCFALIQIAQAWECPGGWDKTHYGCKAVSRYGRGAGYGWRPTDGVGLDKAKKRCKKDHPDVGCEKYDLIYYPKCKTGFTNWLCCTCDFDTYDIPGFNKYGDRPLAYFDVKIQPE